MTTQPLITLLTDFGLSDAYVGTMKGVMLSICPAAQLVDLTHTIEPQNVRQAAYVLLTAFRYFSSQAVHLIVVDPGVGTSREPIAVMTSHGLYVAPNNGVLSYVLPLLTVEHSVVLENPNYLLPGISQTFHGRDIFSPAAAHLAKGVPITDLGPALPELVSLGEPALAVTASQVQGEVLHIDHFGNIITSIGSLCWSGSDVLQFTPRFGSNRDTNRELQAANCRVMIKDHALRAIHPTYGAVPTGTLTALIGSAGQLEIGINQGSAAQSLGVKLGDPVTLTFEP